MSTSTKWGILIGINFCSTDPQRRLSGAINDVEDIHAHLEKHYGPVNVRKFLAEVTDDNQNALPGSKEAWPTLNNITVWLKELARLVQPGDFVYIHFSGHGTLKELHTRKYRDLESIGTDAALILFEPAGSKGIQYWRGFDIAPLLDNIVKNGVGLAVVLDCCHSGGISRDRSTPVRGMPWDDEVASEFPALATPYQFPLPVSMGFNSRIGITDNYWLLRPQGYTIVAACGPHEVAKEIKQGDRFHGAFSYHLLDALRFFSMTGVQPMYGEIIRRIHAKFHFENFNAKFAQQHPILIGAETASFFGYNLSQTHTRSRYNVVHVSEEGHISLNVGRVHGVSLGDEFSIHPATGEHKLLCKVEVQEVFATHSSGKIISLSSSIQVEVGHSAERTALRQPRAYVKLSFNAKHEWEEELHRSPLLQMLGIYELPDVDIPCFSVDIVDEKEYGIKELPTAQFGASEPKKHASRLAGLPPVPTTELGASQRTVKLLEHLAQYKFTENLENNTGQDVLYNSDFEIELNPHPPRTQQEGNLIEVKDRDRIHIIFRNKTSKILYLTILDLQPCRAITRLYPTEKQYQDVPPRQPNTSPRLKGEVKIPIMMEIPENSKRRHQREYGGNLQVEDILKFIVTSRPVCVQGLELPDPWVEAEELGVARDGILDSTLHGNSEFTDHRDENRARWACQNFFVRTSI